MSDDIKSIVSGAVGKINVNISTLSGQIVQKASISSLIAVSGVLSSNTNHLVYLSGQIDKKADRATTLIGYGITDAYTINQIDNINNYLSSQIDNRAIKVTTLSGYGITDAYTIKQIDNTNSYLSGQIDSRITKFTAANISGYLNTNKADKATTLAGYGITDAYTINQIDNINNYLSGQIDKKADRATTLAGYGITNAYTKDDTDTQIDTKIASKVASTFKWKGFVGTSGELVILLPSSEIGDVYAVQEQKNLEYVCSPTVGGGDKRWQPFGYNVNVTTLQKKVTDLQNAGFITNDQELDPIYTAQSGQFVLKSEAPTKLSEFTNDVPYITPSYVENLNTFKWKGEVATFADLQNMITTTSSTVKIGDVWKVTQRYGMEYVCITTDHEPGKAWQPIGCRYEILTGKADLTYVDNNFVKLNGYIPYTQEEKTKLSTIEPSAQVNDKIFVNGIYIQPIDGNINLNVVDTAYLSSYVSGYVSEHLVSDKAIEDLSFRLSNVFEKIKQ